MHYPAGCTVQPYKLITRKQVTLMKIAAFALLLSGLLSATMISSTELKAEAGYAAGNSAQGYGQNRYQRQPSHAGSRYSARPSAYRFRPWSGEPQRIPHVARPAYGPFDRMQQPRQTYRFRPTKLTQATSPVVVAPPALAYRPANITIPEHYVYRPLNPVKKAEPGSHANNISRANPHFSRYGYGAYRAARTMPTAHPADHEMINRPPPAPRYVYGGGLRSVHKFRPDHRVYGPMAYAGPMSAMTPSPYAYNRWRQPLRFRPAPQFRASQPAYAYLPPDRSPGMLHHYPAGGVPWGGSAGPAPRSYPDWRIQRYAGSASQRVDWYDGRSDGEGAWYKLTEQQNWPQLSQNQAGQNDLYSQGAR